MRSPRICGSLSLKGLVTKLRSLTIKFDTYKKHPENNMKKHLRKMTNMISELKDACHTLTDEQ